jgi:glycosyltransferase involved in cell wall biosynthesis
MRVALLTETFSERMGYLESMLPRYLARLGAEVHVIAMDLAPYYWINNFRETYGSFPEPLIIGTVEAHEGYTLHVLGHKKVGGYMRMMGLRKKLVSIRPHVVQTMAAIGWISLDTALLKSSLGYKLFTGCHTTASVFPLANQDLPWWDRKRLRCLLTRAVPGRFTSIFTEKCYAATSDCADVAVRFFGVSQSKVDICPLGVDTELFRPVSGTKDIRARLELRQQLGFAESEIVCIYTGRFTEDKNPMLLATAVARLVRNGEPFRGLFIGNGTQVEAIQSCSGCITHPFVPFRELADFYRAADIGVWPTQESMSMLDAAACGLPIVVNHTMVARERIEGNGLTYTLNDGDDLVRVLLQLRDFQNRRRLGCLGAHKMADKFSWESVARRRLRDYQAAKGEKRSQEERAAETLFERLD